MRNRLVVMSAVCIWLASTGVVDGYFEWKYYCTVQSSNITVSLSTGTKKCFGHIAETTQSIQQVESDIAQANAFISLWTDVAYRNEVLLTLASQKKSQERTKTQVLLAMSDFERSLFNQIKSLLVFYLSEQRSGVLRSIQSISNQSTVALESWNELSFKNLASTMEWLQYKLFLLDRIQFAHDFEEMVPFLKEYLYGNGL